MTEGDRLPAPSERIHLPGPSFLPVVTAVGITFALVGVVISWIVFAIGALVTVVAILRWVASTRSDISELPLEH